MTLVVLAAMMLTGKGAEFKHPRMTAATVIPDVQIQNMMIVVMMLIQHALIFKVINKNQCCSVVL